MCSSHLTLALAKGPSSNFTNSNQTNQLRLDKEHLKQNLKVALLVMNSKQTRRLLELFLIGMSLLSALFNKMAIGKLVRQKFLSRCSNRVSTSVL